MTTTSTTPAGELKSSLHEATVTGKLGDGDASAAAQAITDMAARSETSPPNGSSNTGNASKRGGRRKSLTESDRPVILQLLQQQVNDLRVTGMTVHVRNFDHADGAKALAIIITGVANVDGDFLLLA